MKHTSPILFVISSLGVGGAEKQLTLLAKQLTLRGFQVHIFTLDASSPLKNELSDSGVIIHNENLAYTKSTFKKIWKLIKAEAHLLRLALKIKPIALHSFLPLTNFMGAVAGRLAGVNVIITSKRALGTHQDRHPWWRYFDRIANTLSTIVTANSQAVMNDTIQRDGLCPSKIQVIYNGLSLPNWNTLETERQYVRELLGLKPESIGIAFVANLIPYKGHQDLIQSFSELHKEKPETVLFLIGEDRGIEKKLKKQASALGLSESIHFLGQRKDVHTLLIAMDVGVISSHEEGFSNALLEKLSAGLPVVATNVGGNAEAIQGLQNCVLVPAKSPSELTKALHLTINCLKLDKQHQLPRRQIVSEKYSVQAMVNAYVNLYSNK